MTISIFHPASIFPMGEDSAYLIIRIQEEFSIEFTDAELANIATVGELYNLVLSKLETGDSCRSSQAFYRLRQAMTACLYVPRKSIHPATNLAILLPESKRYLLWKKLENESRLTFPKLRHPRWARDVIRSIALAAAIAAQILMARWWHPHAALWVPLEIAVFCVFAVVRQSLYAVTPSLGRGLPVRTVGELTKILLSDNFSLFTPEAGNVLPYSPNDVWDQLVHIFSDELQVDANKIKPQTRFDEDLNLA